MTQPPQIDADYLNAYPAEYFDTPFTKNYSPCNVQKDNAMSWQPIETIPEIHGDQLLVHGSGHYAVVSYYDNTVGLEYMTNGWYISDGANDPIWHRAQYMMTEWMHIPPSEHT